MSHSMRVEVRVQLSGVGSLFSHCWSRVSCFFRAVCSRLAGPPVSRKFCFCLSCCYRSSGMLWRLPFKMWFPRLGFRLSCSDSKHCYSLNHPAIALGLFVCLFFKDSLFLCSPCIPCWPGASNGAQVSSELTAILLPHTSKG